MKVAGTRASTANQVAGTSTKVERTPMQNTMTAIDAANWPRSIDRCAALGATASWVAKSKKLSTLVATKVATPRVTRSDVVGTVGAVFHLQCAERGV